MCELGQLVPVTVAEWRISLVERQPTEVCTGIELGERSRRDSLARESDEDSYRKKNGCEENGAGTDFQ